MSLTQSAVITWIFITIFMIMLTLKLESKINYPWFAVFTAFFTIRAIDLVWILVRIGTHVRTYRDPQDVSIKRKIWNIGNIILELLFIILLCLKLDEHVLEMKLYYVMIPLWILLIGNAINFFHYQIMVVRGQQLSMS